jgi:hypothetical protein
MAAIEGVFGNWYGFCKVELMVAGEILHAEVLTLPNGMSKVRCNGFFFWIYVDRGFRGL